MSINQISPHRWTVHRVPACQRTLLSKFNVRRSTACSTSWAMHGARAQFTLCRTKALMESPSRDGMLQSPYVKQPRNVSPEILVNVSTYKAENEKRENRSKKISFNFLHNLRGQKRGNLKVFSESFSLFFSPISMKTVFVRFYCCWKIHQTSAPDISTVKNEINLGQWWLNLILFISFWFNSSIAKFAESRVAGLAGIPQCIHGDQRAGRFDGIAFWF